MRYSEIIAESIDENYRLYHGSNYDNITIFRTENLRNRTGTPGTLSFTTSIETAKIYGQFIYEAQIRGNFGDYLQPEDVAANFAYRWPAHEKWLRTRYKPEEVEAGLVRAATADRKDIVDGHYAMWEHVGIWRQMGWDGAWCHESGSRNLIINNMDCIQHVRLLNPPDRDDP